MKVLVTGGAGYIGSTVADHLLIEGHEVVVLDSLITGHRGAVPPGARFLAGDVHDREVLNAVMAGQRFDAVMHFAASIEAGESMLEPGRYFHNNVAGSLVLIEAAVAHGIPKFVFSSSAAVYAGKDTPLVEDDPLQPANVYGATKLMVEQILGWYGRTRGLRYAALRYFNASGATRLRGEEHHPETHLIPLVLQVAAGKRPYILIYGIDYPTPDGTCVRDYVHVRDLASAHALALHKLDSELSLICNLGNGSGFSVRQVIDTARLITGHSIPAVEAARRAGDAATLVADAALARGQLGWIPAVTRLEQIITDAWEWQARNPHGYH